MIVPCKEVRYYKNKIYRAGENCPIDDVNNNGPEKVIKTIKKRKDIVKEKTE